jgi:hypothetical protein
MLKELIALLEDVAPTLATALGGPLAGGMVSLIGSIFGNPAATPGELANLIKGDPDSSTKIKEIELHMQQLSSDVEIYKTEVDDKKDARAHAVDYKNLMKNMAYLVTLGFFVALFLMFFDKLDMNSDEKNLLAMLVGVLSSKFQTIIDFYFGSAHKS